MALRAAFAALQFFGSYRTNNGHHRTLSRRGSVAINLGHEAALFVAMHATEAVRPAVVSPRRLALGYTMFAHVKFGSAFVGLVCIAVGCMNGRASAVTAEVARKCAALTAKAYPPQMPGNPVAGLAK